MPQIPFQVSERSIPGATGSPFMPTSDPVGAALQQGGLQIEHAANRLQEVAAMRERLRQSNDAEFFNFDYQKGAGQILDNLKTDSTLDENKVNEQLGELRNQLYQKYSDPGVQQFAQKKMLAVDLHVLEATRVKLMDNELSRSREATDITLAAGINEAADMVDPVERDLKIGQLNKYIDEKGAGSVYDAEKGGLLKRHLVEQVAIGYFMKLGASNPTQALAELKGIEKPKLWEPNQNDLRKDGTQKGTGWLGVLPITSPDGKTGAATEYTVGVTINGKNVDIPTLVPTLSKEQVKVMTEDIIPNHKKE